MLGLESTFVFQDLNTDKKKKLTLENETIKQESSIQLSFILQIKLEK